MAMPSSQPPTLYINSTIVFRPAPFEIENGVCNNQDFVMCSIKTEDHLQAIQEYQKVHGQLIGILREQSKLQDTSSAWGLTLLGRKLMERTPAWSSHPEELSYSPQSTLITPTVFIVCLNPAMIEQEVATISIHCSLRIEIQSGEISLYSSSVLNTGCKGYEEKVSMGRSLGCAGSFAPGSLGGWIIDVTSQEKFAITAGHVTLGHRYGQLKSLPYSESGQVIMQPADPDFDEILAEAEKQYGIAHVKSEQCGFMYPRLERPRLEMENRVNVLKDLSTQRMFGTVIHGSISIVTSEQDPGRKMWKDYGIISALPARTGDSAYGYIGAPLTPANGQVAVHGGQRISKSFTRSTGEMSGEVNGIYLDTNLSCRLLESPRLETTREWIAIGDHNDVMSAPGDSGALLTDAENNVVGMIIGGMTRKRIGKEQRLVDNITVFTPSEQILAWIKDELGRDVVFGG